MHIVPKEVLLFSQIFGGLPLKYDVAPKGNKVVVFSLKVFVWGLIVIVIQNATSIFALYVDFTSKLIGEPIRMSSNTSMVAVTLDIVALNMMAVVAFFSSATKHRRFTEMCRTLEQVDAILPRDLVKADPTMKVFLVFLHMTTLLVVSVTIESISYVKAHGKNRFVFYYPFYTTYFAQAALFIHFTYVTQSIYQRFRTVNNKFRQEEIKLNFRRLMKNPRRRLPSVDIIAVEPLGISDLISLYWLLCEAVRQANKFYSSQLLAAIFSSLVHIIITLYYFFLSIWPTIELDQAFYLSMQGIWIVTHVSHLVLLIWPTTAVTAAANETASLVCKLINSDPHSEKRDELASFLLQLLHHNARFSALGFFKIQRDLLTTIAGSVTSYLVFLIQFQTTPTLHPPPHLNTTV